METKTRSKRDNKKDIVLPGDPKYRDHLEEDPIIRTQQYACISFVAPTADQKCDIVGFKIRGVFASEKEAHKKAERLKRIDPDFHIYVCRVGLWCPFNPDPDEIEDEVYNEAELNEIVRGYKENRVKLEEFNQERKQELIKNAIKEGAKKNRQEVEEKGEHPVAIKDKLVRLPKDIEKMKKQLEEAEKELQEKQKEWSMLSEEEAKKAEKEYNEVINGNYKTEEEKEAEAQGQGQGTKSDPEPEAPGTIEEEEGKRQALNEKLDKLVGSIKKHEEKKKEVLAELERENENENENEKKDSEVVLGSSTYINTNESKKLSPEEMKKMEEEFRKKAFGNPGMNDSIFEDDPLTKRNKENEKTLKNKEKLEELAKVVNG